MGIPENIKKLREIHDLTQSELGKIAGVSDKAIWTWENGTAEPRMGAVQRIADHFNIKKSAIIDELEPNLEGVTNLIYPAAYPVPILGTICAGNGVWCEENFQGTFYIDKSIKADLCLEVKGSSMVDAGINDGDYAFIRKNFDFINGRIYAVRINSDCEVVLKKVNIKGETVILSPCSAEYEPIIDTYDNVSIVGECVGVYHSAI